MFRVTQYLREIAAPTPPAAPHATGPVVIWNLIRRCNLCCQHCYSISADRDFAGELTTAQALAVLADLAQFRVPALILSGGEPLLRPDLFDIAREAKRLGIFLGLSTNGTLIDRSLAARIADASFDYVGISLDGLKATHDRFRRRNGGFDEALNGLRLTRDAGLKVGVRFTLTEGNAHELGALLDLAQAEGFGKFYLSHLNYSGRGNINRRKDALLLTTRRAMDLIFERAWAAIERGESTEFVTGNNDADAVYLLQWVRKRFPGREAHLRARLAQWGGNASGSGVANIDNLGNVHPDTYWWDHHLGNVRERPFSAIWSGTRDALMVGLRRRPRPLEGRCGACRYVDVCNGNTRVRAFQTTGNYWAEDPACYLSDEELGIADPAQRAAIAEASA